MKRFIQALVAVAALAAVTPAHAASPVVKLSGEASLTGHAAVGSPAEFRVRVRFATDTPGAEPFTLQRAVVFFPDRAGTNGRLFPSCSAARIERFRGNVRRCPKGSIIGTGTVTARALPLGITATGRVTMFNSARGKRITLNIQTHLPAYINESLDAPLTRLRGGPYGEKLTLVVPQALQEILAGVYVGVQDFDVTIRGVTRADGMRHSFIKARRCPTRPLRGVFDFLDRMSGQTVSATASAKVACTVR